jgi:uncharacterized coiled-coil protein SlyX
MFFGYSLHLGARTVKLEKKNGHEQEQINQLQEKVKELKRKLSKNQKKLKTHGNLSTVPKEKTIT